MGTETIIGLMLSLRVPELGAWVLLGLFIRYLVLIKYQAKLQMMLHGFSRNYCKYRC